MTPDWDAVSFVVVSTYRTIVLDRLRRQKSARSFIIHDIL